MVQPGPFPRTVSHQTLKRSQQERAAVWYLVTWDIRVAHASVGIQNGNPQVALNQEV